jgi:ubiquinone/menaquinone biosynthesis C-methylase UbiE
VTKKQVDYDQIAPDYDRRFASEDDRRFTSAEMAGRGETLRALIAETGADRVLEVGCGTGHWLASLSPLACQLYGLDASTGMLRQAQRHGLGLALGHARHLPFETGSFDIVYCVNAIHHFAKPRAFVLEAARILGPAGVLAVFGSDPHNACNSWYLYDYFDGTYERDLQRFPSWRDVQQWMTAAGLENVELREVEHIVDAKIGRDVLDDPFLRKSACSQLALLTDSAYAMGMRKLGAALREAEASGKTMIFKTELSVEMMTGRK